MVTRDYVVKYFEWRQQQATSLASACFTLSGLILAPLLAAVVDGQSEIEVWQVVVYSLGASLAAVSGAWWHRDARREQKQYREWALGDPPKGASHPPPNW